ncbi:hypothetical protein [Pedobacter nyackensis]|uniref:Uncharacterized protein n=1 Tax=Pedobacter nyackensis TaxID=475255 RepID=A0A1W1ZYH8_9SPHI|nr:hypothetical protein [Pedobacter nyackensis]SMC53201.1 hypothetical protein SAMN04488101_101137 [Pedobacter nyackensis]
MAKQTTIDEQANTPAPGAEGAAENATGQENQPAAAVIETPATLLVAETPDWVQTIIDSNQTVLDSNNKVLAGLESFKEHATSFVEDIIEKSTARAEGGPVMTGKPAKEKEVDLFASYVVAEGKSFRDSKDFSKVYESGDPIEGLNEDRLKNLLNQGLIEEA